MTLEAIFGKYDMKDVFQIIFPTLDAQGTQTGALELNTAGNEAKSINLFVQYNELTIEMVAESCQWYAQWPDSDDAPWFQENLSLSFEYLQNHTEPELWGKIMEDIAPYRGTQKQGGPLVFISLIKRIQVNSQLVIESYQVKLKALRIDKYPGEDVSLLVGHARAIFNRLKSLERRHPDGTVISPTIPYDIGKTLVRLFQTSSDTRFNEVFHSEEITGYKRSLTEGDKAYGSYESILNLALEVYTSILSSPEGWTGLYHKANETGFSAVANNPRCFNCGSQDHTLKQCPEPKDELRIKKNKKAFWDARDASTGGRGGGRGRGRGGRGNGRGRGRGRGNGGRSSWPSPPTDRDKNTAQINGKWHYYHFNARKWLPCADQSDAVNRPRAAVTLTPTPPAQPPSESPPALIATSDSSRVSSLHQATASVVSDINTAMQRWSSQVDTHVRQ
jgi:uncharacterized membrane protein YgcG